MMKKLFKLLPLILLLSLFFILSCSKEDDGSSCGKIIISDFNTESTAITLYLDFPNSANSAKIEYGITGFTQGTGTSIVTSESYHTITHLNPSTTYDIYVTGICSSSEISDVTKLSSITTSPSQCNGITSATFFQTDVQQIEVYCSYNDSTPSYFEAEYGVTGFSLGTGTTIRSDNSIIRINNIQPNTTYDVYVRAVCHDWTPNDKSSFVKYTYTTMGNCPKPHNLSSTLISGSCNSGTAYRNFSWHYSYSPQPSSFTVVVTTQGGNPDQGQHYTTSSNSIAFSGMFCLWKEFYVRANCQNGQNSGWAGPYYFN